MTQRGGPPNAAASTVIGEQVPALAATEALKDIEAQTLRLTSQHAAAVKQAETAAQSHGRVAKRNDARVRAVARQRLAGQPTTAARWSELERQVGRELELARRLVLAQERVKLLAMELEDAQLMVEFRAQNLAQLVNRAPVLAQQRTQQAERARPPIVRVVAFLRLV